MKKIHLTLIIWSTLAHIKQVIANNDGKNDSSAKGPYQPVLFEKHVVNHKGVNIEHFYLPIEASISPEGIPISHTESDHQDVYLCPESDSKRIDKMSEHCDKFDYCLFVKQFQPGEEKKCQVRPKPELVKNIHEVTNRQIHCNDSKRNVLYSFTLKYCFTKEEFDEMVNKRKPNNLFAIWVNKIKWFRKEIVTPLYLGLYTICFNTFAKQTAWTKHNVLLPSTYMEGNYNTRDSTSQLTESFDHESDFSENDVAATVPAFEQGNFGIGHYETSPLADENENPDASGQPSRNSLQSNDEFSTDYYNKSRHQELSLDENWESNDIDDQDSVSRSDDGSHFSDEIDATHFNMKNRFAEMDRVFRAQEKNSVSYMIPQRLVPKEDMIFDIWKDATSHYINIAPLWIELRRLLKVINEGIRKAAVTLQKRLLHRNHFISNHLLEYGTDKYRLQVYTAVYNLNTTVKPRRYLNGNKKFPVPDIWCKIVYKKAGNEAIAIFVHNTPGMPPDKNTYQCPQGVMFTCDFQTWGDEETTERIRYQEYAYCCMVTYEIIRKLFVKTELENFERFLDIEDLIDGDPEYRFDSSFVLVQRYHMHDVHYHLPQRKTRQNDVMSYAYEANESIIDACPAETAEDLALIHEISEKFWGMEYCLIKKTFADKDESRICNIHVEPLLIIERKRNQKSLTCGQNGMGDPMEFVYPYCYSTSELKNYVERVRRMSYGIRPEPVLQDIPLILMYEICYDDIRKNTAYTHHRILSPALLAQQNSPNEIAYECQEISIDRYNVKNEKFLIHKKAFQYNMRRESNPDQMIPQMMVPTEDMALPLWKKATCHYININPLWYKLAQVMNMINARIRNIAIEKSRELSVYTTLLYPQKYNDEGNLNNATFNKVFPIPDVWCKLVYDDVDKLGVAVIIHNTPHNPPSTHQLCQDNRFECNFKNWPEMSQTVDEGYLRYAYCCEVTVEIEKVYRNKAIQVEGVLDLNTISNVGEDFVTVPKS